MWSVKFLPVKCQCGHAPARIRAVGLTTARQLAIHWRCPVCKQYMYVLKDLADCWRECPKLEGQAVEPLPEWNENAADEHFLRRMGIRSRRGTSD